MSRRSGDFLRCARSSATVCCDSTSSAPAAVAKLKVTPAKGAIGIKVTVAAGAKAALHSTVTVTINDIGSQNPGPVICKVKITTKAQESTWHCSGKIPPKPGRGEKFIDANNPKFLGSFEFDVT
jgi:hypothetical protein